MRKIFPTFCLVVYIGFFTLILVVNVECTKEKSTKTEQSRSPDNETSFFSKIATKLRSFFSSVEEKPTQKRIIIRTERKSGAAKEKTKKTDQNIAAMQSKDEVELEKPSPPVKTERQKTKRKIKEITKVTSKKVVPRETTFKLGKRNRTRKQLPESSNVVVQPKRGVKKIEIPAEKKRSSRRTPQKKVTQRIKEFSLSKSERRKRMQRKKRGV